MNDQQITELIKSDQDMGIAQLHKDYKGLIHYIVNGILKDKSEVEECVSDIHLKVWRSIDSFSPEKGKFSTWLTVISRNTALNYLKRRRRDDLELNEELVSSSSLESDVIRRERAEELKRSLRALSAEEQQIFYRKYYYLQLTSKIAKEMGLTERSVEGKLYRLRKKLQKELGGDFR